MSASSTYYVLAYLESLVGIKRGELVMQVGQLKNSVQSNSIAQLLAGLVKVCRHSKPTLPVPVCVNAVVS